jgi:hypothetical protein
MRKRHLAIGVIVWLTIAWLGFRWIARPIVWVNRPQLGGPPINLNDARKQFPTHFAKYSTDKPILSRGGLFDDEEFDAEGEAVRDWAFRETRNRFFIGFILWMASGWFIHWFLGRIVRGQKDYT